MTVQKLEQELLKLSPREKLRIIQLLLQSLDTPQLLVSQESPISILDRLAALNACQSIPDPITWQRSQRHDRPLPGRDS
jgi:hypothetical protein